MRALGGGLATILWLSHWLCLSAGLAAAREPGEPIRLVWSEGDVAGMSPVYGPEGGAPIGFIEYHQTRRGEVLSAVRVTRFADGSSDEDWVEARAGATLEALGGRSLVRDTDGETLADLRVDVAAGRITATWGRGADRRSSDETVALPAGTYWGPLIFVVLKNFDANAADGRLAFRTVAPTPQPFVLDMELRRDGSATLSRLGVPLETERFRLRPTIHWAIDPIVRLVAPEATFWVLAGEPPALARFTGPRNYRRQPIRIE